MSGNEAAQILCLLSELSGYFEETKDKWNYGLRCREAADKMQAHSLELDGIKQEVIASEIA